MSAYPPPPWRLYGSGLVRLCALPVEQARVLVPSALDIIELRSGRALGVLYVGRYEKGSTLRYSELIVAPALARRGLRWGAWISHIYVDDERSVMGGRAIWGLPKQLAHFDWNDAGTAVTIYQNRRALCQLETHSVGLGGRLPVLAPAFGMHADTPAWFYGRGSMRLTHAHIAVEVAEEAPFAPAGFDSGRGLRIEDMRLSVLAPRAHRD